MTSLCPRQRGGRVRQTSLQTQRSSNRTVSVLVVVGTRLEILRVTAKVVFSTSLHFTVTILSFWFLFDRCLFVHLYFLVVDFVLISVSLYIFVCLPICLPLFLAITISQVSQFHE